MCSSGDVPLLTDIFSVYVVGRNFEETDEAGEITRLDGYHEEVLLLIKFIFVLIRYPGFSFCATEKMRREYFSAREHGMMTKEGQVGGFFARESLLSR